MRTVPVFVLLSLLAACKPAPKAETETPTSPTTSSTPSSSPDVQAAQTVINQTNQGRACTTLTKTQLESTIDSTNPEYAKRQVLIKHGLVTVKKVTGGNGTLNWELYTNHELNEADGKGIFIPEGHITYYCFGRWVVTDAHPTDKFPAEAGNRMLLATVELRDAVDWIATDPAADDLARSSISNDPAFLPALNQYDKPVPPSFTIPNQVAVLVPAQ